MQQLNQARAAAAERPDDEDNISYWHMIKASPIHHRVFLLMICLQCLVVVLERIVLFSLTDDNSPDAIRENVYFFCIIIVSVAFVGYFAIHSVLQCNSFEMLAFFVSSTMLLARVAVEFVNRGDECDNHGDICLSFLVLSISFIAGAMVFTRAIAKDLEWKRYKAIGAAGSTRKLYQLFEAFSAVRKLDLQFSIITLITGLVFFGGQPAWDSPATYALIVNCLMFVIEIAWEITGDVGIKREEPYYLIVFWALSLFLPMFIVTIAVDVFRDNVLLASATSTSVRLTIAIMAGLALLNRGITVGLSVALYRSFGPAYVGLKRIIASDRKKKFNRHRVAKMLPVGASMALPPGQARATQAPAAATPVVTVDGQAAVEGNGAVPVGNPFLAVAAVGTPGVEEWGRTSKDGAGIGTGPSAGQGAAPGPAKLVAAGPGRPRGPDGEPHV